MKEDGNIGLEILFKGLTAVTGHVGIWKNVMFMWECYNLLYSQLVKIVIFLLIQLINQEEENNFETVTTLPFQLYFSY